LTGLLSVAQVSVAAGPTMGLISLLGLGDDLVMGQREEPAPVLHVSHTQQTARRTAGKKTQQGLPPEPWRKPLKIKRLR
jgi:hypothetical protein